MKAEVFVVGQSADNRVWDSTYADLQRSPVGDMLCDGVADGGLGRARFRSGYLNQRVVDLYGSRGSPKLNGMWGLSWAITVFAHSVAAVARSAETPKLT